MFKKRAQGLSITVIVAAVIGLIIIVVVIAILTGKLGAFGKGAEEIGNIAKTCTEQGGVMDDNILVNGECPGQLISIISSDSIAKGKKCCKYFGSST